MRERTRPNAEVVDTRALSILVFAATMVGIRYPPERVAPFAIVVLVVAQAAGLQRRLSRRRSEKAEMTLGSAGLTARATHVSEH